ncbi:hypothetical protein ON010_g10012 [Phytophthora cinnamomi]|nr:hypothetical protein ON010_g10012 [Phytophthora cinnamomi]
MGRWLTIENKRELIDKSAAEPGMTHSELARWSKRAFRLRKAPARNTVSDILKNASTIKKPEYGEGKRRKPLKVKAPALEKNLEEWVGSVEARGLCFNRKAITRKAEQIREDVGGPALDVGLAVGWLTGFLKRHKLRYRPRHGEAGSAVADEVREGRHAIQEITDCYDAHDTYNMDEIGLYYAAAPGRIQKLPANTTTYLQPLDAGVIASFKAHFRSLQIDHGIERFEADANVNGQSAYKIDQLQAMQWSSLLWSSTEAKTVAHCWQKTGLATPLRGNDELDEDGEDEGVEEGDADGEIVDLMLKVASISL